MSLRELFFGFDPATIAKHPECFQEINDVVASGGKRTVPMEVLSLSLSRTGTASMQAALSILGYKTYHGFQAMANEHFDLWLAAYENKYHGKPSPECHKLDKQFFDKVIGRFGAVTDMPTSSFAEELIDLYPDAKVVLVNRDENAWYKSWGNVMFSSYDSIGLRIAAWLDPRRTGIFFKVFIRGVVQGHFRANTGEEFRRNSIPIYREHNETVRRVLRERGEEHRLLEYRLGEGWRPLCEFLGKPIPDGKEFPTVNESTVMDEKMQVIMLNGVRRTAVRWLSSHYTLLLLLVGAAWVSWYVAW
ncbi:hypothetical protein PRZ48_004382 [Zasmidium cellare]|uniref:Sulfotransferase n=1 Tax=Zasmidium cellare TaxID=395010 RepID=A0ABR0EPQ8_ZASCE|nr:hypothetical protein PRZ48_004382 [Zasmidium cellare]